MKNQFLFFSLLLCGSVFGQDAVYQPFEVDSAAQPRGGMPYLNAFLQANLRKPVAAEAKGTGGRVIVSGIVEADGHISEVKAMQSTSPDFNREAVRAFGLYNAWQPAQKAGKAVRQQVSIPVMFKPNPPFTYADGAQINYFDADKKPVAEGSEQVRYKQVSPVDTSGFPTGDIIVYKAKGSNWKEDYRLPLVQTRPILRESSWGPTYLIGHQNGDKQWQGEVFTMDNVGAVVSQEYYQNGRRNGLQLTYHARGLVIERSDEADGKQAITSWYPTGQIKQIGLVDERRPMGVSAPEQVTAFWDSTGQQLVQDGNGRALYTDRRKSYRDTTRQTTYVEQGLYANGVRQGVWTGRYADDSYFYEEEYDKGICQGGKALVAGRDTVSYAAPQEQPEFAGRMKGLGMFLAQNLRYPADAQRARQQGKVFISFVVCADGTLCDYAVLKGVTPSLDQEALRVVKATSGRWKPGTQRGQKVRVKYNMPISFTLE